jgi:hypothetical protein
MRHTNDDIQDDKKMWAVIEKGERYVKHDGLIYFIGQRFITSEVKPGRGMIGEPEVVAVHGAEGVEWAEGNPFRVAEADITEAIAPVSRFVVGEGYYPGNLPQPVLDGLGLPDEKEAVTTIL